MMLELILILMLMLIQRRLLADHWWWSPSQRGCLKELRDQFMWLEEPRQRTQLSLFLQEDRRCCLLWSSWWSFPLFQFHYKQKNPKGKYFLTSVYSLIKPDFQYCCIFTVPQYLVFGLLTIKISRELWRKPKSLLNFLIDLCFVVVFRRFKHLPSKFVVLPLPLPAAVGTLHRLTIWVIMIGLIEIFLSILIWLFISWFILFVDFML